MLVSHTHRFVFVHVYKTGGTSIANALSAFCDDAARQRVGFKHATAAELRALLPQLNADIGEYEWFACVRNPFDLHVSLWQWIAHHRHPDSATLARLSFPEYVEWLQAVAWQRPAGDRGWGGRPLDGSNRLPRYLTLTEFLCDARGLLLVDRILRTEHLDRDFRQLADDLGLDVRLEHANRTEHAPYTGYYDARSRSIIAEHHAEDLERFDYAF